MATRNSAASPPRKRHSDQHRTERQVQGGCPTGRQPNPLLTARSEMPGTGVEPARPNGHMALNHARLPIPPPGQAFLGVARTGGDPQLKHRMLNGMRHLSTTPRAKSCPARSNRLLGRSWWHNDHILQGMSKQGGEELKPPPRTPLPLLRMTGSKSELWSVYRAHHAAATFPVGIVCTTHTRKRHLANLPLTTNNWKTED